MTESHHTITLLYPTGMDVPMHTLQSVIGSVNRQRFRGDPPGSWMLVACEGSPDRFGWTVKCNMERRRITDLVVEAAMGVEVYKRSWFAILGA